MSRTKKLISVLAIFLSMTRAKKENVVLEIILYIYYLFHFQNIIFNIRALIGSNSEVNTITLAYATKLGTKIPYTNIKVQKINSFCF